VHSTGLAAASEKAYQLLAHGQWFSPGTPASSTIKTGCHDIAEILLKVSLNTRNQIKSNQLMVFHFIKDKNRLTEVDVKKGKITLVENVVYYKILIHEI